LSTATINRPMEAPVVDSATMVGPFENLFRLNSTDTTELIMVRHAEPDYQAASSSSDPLDPPLTERGRGQAVRLAQRMGATQIDAIYSSTMRRAIETAAIVAAAKDLPIIAAPQLREVAVGSRVLTNGAKKDPQKLASQVLMRFLNNPRWDAIQGLEPSREFRHRVVQAVDAIITEHPGERVILVTHAGVINAYLSMVLDIQRDMFFLPEHASISVLRVLRDLWAVQNINDYSHLLPTFSPS
jgi:2,3-bisphosphoglycerate-dependent phosphoglycerate mutase